MGGERGGVGRGRVRGGGDGVGEGGGRGGVSPHNDTSSIGFVRTVCWIN